VLHVDVHEVGITPSEYPGILSRQIRDGINVETYGNPDGAVASGPGMVGGPPVSAS
jgi:hypothetical protein